MKANRIKGQELWLRCPYCGDSTRSKSKAHFHVNLETGLYICHRCQASGRVPKGVLLQLVLSEAPEIGSALGSSMQIDQVLPGAGSERKSLLKRFHTDQHDAFQTFWPTLPKATQAGWYLRSQTKGLYGFSGISWPGAPDLPLISDDLQPLHLVEGPYDVQTIRDVCLFSYYPRSLLRFFRTHTIILTPDGDTWVKNDLFQILLSRVSWMLDQHFDLQGVEYLPSGKDPDEGERQLIPISYFKEKLCSTRSLSSKVRRELEKAL